MQVTIPENEVSIFYRLRRFGEDMLGKFTLIITHVSILTFCVYILYYYNNNYYKILFLIYFPFFIGYINN